MEKNCLGITKGEHAKPIGAGAAETIIDTEATANYQRKNVAPSIRNNTSASAVPSIENGTGHITTSGTVVSGHDTKFEKEIHVGDAILVTISLPDNTTAEEMRIVTMRLSNVSLNLSSAFSQNLSEPQSFRFVRKPKNLEQERRKERQKQLEEANEIEKSAFDIYGKDNRGGGENTVFTFREKTETGSYRVKQQHVSSSGSITRADLLDLRSKKTSDKYC